MSRLCPVTACRAASAATRGSSPVRRSRPRFLTSLPSHLSRVPQPLALPSDCLDRLSMMVANLPPSSASRRNCSASSRAASAAIGLPQIYDARRFRLLLIKSHPASAIAPTHTDVLKRTPEVDRRPSPRLHHGRCTGATRRVTRRSRVHPGPTPSNSLFAEAAVMGECDLSRLGEPGPHTAASFTSIHIARGHQPRLPPRPGRQEAA